MTVEELIETHSGTEYWVIEVRFSPGTDNVYPIDDKKTITASKYKKLRTWSPARCICIDGKATVEYPVESPGGYQLIGRSLANFYEPEQLNPIFKNNPILTKPGYSHKYIPIGEEEYYNTREKVKKWYYSHENELPRSKLRGIRP